MGLLLSTRCSGSMRTCGCSCSNHLSPSCVPPRNLEEEIVIYIAKEIVTMDPSWPTATAVAVQGGRILSVGSLEDMKPWIDGACPHRVDRTFEDLVIVSGFIEPHIHPVIGGTAMSLPCLAFNDTPNPYGPQIKGIKTKEQAIARLRENAEKLPPGELLTAWGWDSTALKCHLDRHVLDKVSTTRPIFVWDCSMHFGYTNSKTIADLGLKASRCRHVSGVQFDNDGELSGAFLGNNAIFLLRPLFKQFAHVDRSLKSIRYLSDLARQGGITTMGEMMLGAFDLTLEERLYDIFFNEKSVPLRLLAVVDANKQLHRSLGWSWLATYLLGKKQKESTEKLIYNNGIKFFMDDAFLGLTMQLNHPGYIDGHAGVWTSKPGAATMERMYPFWKAGCRIHVHTNGHASQDALAKILHALQSRYPRFDHRFCFEHYGMSSEYITRRLKALGANASVNPFYIYHRADINEEHIGVDRSHTASKFKSLVDNGVVAAMHTDTPVAPPRPLEEIWIAVNRFSLSGKCLAPTECLSVYQALRMKTIDAAYVLGIDDVCGSIEPGKFADFVILKENPLKVEKTKIKDIEIWGTVSGGVPFPRQKNIEITLSPPKGFMPGLVWLFASTSTNIFMKTILGWVCKWLGINPHQRN